MATNKRWTKGLLLFTLAITIVSVAVLRESDRRGGSASSHDQWPPRSAAPPAGLWLELSDAAGVLQGVGDYQGVGLSLIGEQGARLVLGGLLAAAGLGVSRAYLGTPSHSSPWACSAFPAAPGTYGGRGRGARCGDAPGPPAAAGLTLCGPRQARLGADRRPDHHRGPPEHRHHRRQAPVQHERRQLLRRGRGRGQGPHLGRDGAGFYLVPEGLAPCAAAGEDPRPILFRALGIGRRLCRSRCC